MQRQIHRVAGRNAHAASSRPNVAVGVRSYVLGDPNAQVIRRDTRIPVRCSLHGPEELAAGCLGRPGPVPGFTGRDDELTVLAGLLGPASTAGPMVVSAVAGMAGVGKTTLAVQAGHAAVARGWFSGGALFIDLHGYDDQRAEPGQALDEMLRALGALTNLGAALRQTRRFGEAIRAHQDAAAIFQQTGDQHGQGSALTNLGDALRQAGRFEEAITAHQAAVAVFRETGDRHREGMALNNLGMALREVRRFEEAITAHQAAATCGNAPKVSLSGPALTVIRAGSRGRARGGAGAESLGQPAGVGDTRRQRARARPVLVLPAPSRDPSS